VQISFRKRRSWGISIRGGGCLPGWEGTIASPGGGRGGEETNKRGKRRPEFGRGAFAEGDIQRNYSSEESDRIRGENIYCLRWRGRERKLVRQDKKKKKKGREDSRER